MWHVDAKDLHSLGALGTHEQLRAKVGPSSSILQRQSGREVAGRTEG